MSRSFSLLSGCFLILTCASLLESAHAQSRQIPEALKPWQDWATWDDQHFGCPPQFDGFDKRICFWPSRLTLSVRESDATFDVGVNVYSETWVPLPGNGDTWPIDVRANDEPVVVIARDGIPSVRLPAGEYQVTGQFRWASIPQRIAIPSEVGILSLTVNDDTVQVPSWDAAGHVWLRRIRAEVADEDLLAAQVYRVVEDGIPMWLRTDIELTVSGKSREEELGWVLPTGWTLAMVDSPIPVAVDDVGRVKAQVRAGKWIVAVHAFRSTDLAQFEFSEDAQPIASVELVGFRAQPEFRMAQLEGIQSIDVSQTTFPDKWRNLPVFQWDTATPFQLVEKMRGMGLQRPAGLTINRHFWLDEDGKGLTFRDQISGEMQQIWRLDVAAGQELGAVRVEGKGQLITRNPQDSELVGVEVRQRNLNLEAIGRTQLSETQPWFRTADLSATGWQQDVDSLSLTLSLPPGWRVFALFGADRVEGDWLTEWSLLDLFLLLIFSLAVFRLWGVKAGIIGFLAFGLAYHEPAAPRYTWLFLLIPLALLRVVPEGTSRRWILGWRNLAITLLALSLVPFIALQIQSAIYPQLERPGVNYQSRGLFWRYGAPSGSARYGRVITVTEDSKAADDGRMPSGQEASRARFDTSNLLYDPSARIQTGPAEPEWSWNQVTCYWNGPVSRDQRITPMLISVPLHRLLTVVRLALVLVLAAVLLGVGRFSFLSKRVATAAAVMICLLVTNPAHAQPIPSQDVLNQLRERLLQPADAFPRAAEITSANVRVNDGRIVTQTEIHAAAEVAVPLPGRLPAWSPLTVTVDGQPNAVVCRKDGYLWVVVPQGVHQVTVEGLLPDTTDWAWTFLLKPRRVSIDAPDWTVTGVRANGIPEDQVFFAQQQPETEGQAAYDRRDFNTIVAVNRYLEAGLIWQVRTEVTRLSSRGRAVSLQIPLLATENVLTSNVVVEDGSIQVNLGADQDSFSWSSELPIGQAIDLSATQTDRWVERWHLVASPVWNVAPTGLSPIYATNQQNLIPTWHPWPGESVNLAFSRPDAVRGDIMTIRSVEHKTTLGSRQRTSELKMEVECSLGSDFAIDLDANADISTLKLEERLIPVRRDGNQVIVPLQPGRQSVEMVWRTAADLPRVFEAEAIGLPVDSANATTLMVVPESRWVLWADGPVRGPAVRFWTILVVAVLAALILGSIPLSPLRRYEWVLLAIGLTQVNIVAAMIVVVWLFLLAWRGTKDVEQSGTWRFNLGQIGLVFITAISLGILVVVVGEGLLGNPEMFIVGNGSTRTYLNWFQPRIGSTLPQPWIISISVWFYRLLMLFWALWLASALIRWLKWGWMQYSHGGCWKRNPPKNKAQPLVKAEVVE